MDKDVVRVSRVSQDGVRVRVSAGGGSFRRRNIWRSCSQKRVSTSSRCASRWSLQPYLLQPVSVRRGNARSVWSSRPLRNCRSWNAGRQCVQARWAKGPAEKKVRARQPRVSTTDLEARRMKMPNGGFNPAVNVQLATDTESWAILGVEVSNEGSDNAGLSEPMRQQVERRTAGKVQQHLLDGGYMRKDDLERAHAASVELFVPPKPSVCGPRQGRELEPRRGDSPAILDWKQRMASETGKEIYRQRAATSETVNADLRSYRGLTQITVRGLKKARCVALWCALAYNLMHFGHRLLA